jgi:hypothetical protein
MHLRLLVHIFTGTGERGRLASMAERGAPTERGRRGGPKTKIVKATACERGGRHPRHGQVETHQDRRLRKLSESPRQEKAS